MDHVVNSLTHCVPELDHARAADVMLEAHAHGMALVITCPHERATRYRNCLESRGLTATIEPA
ncbi:MAG: Clp protease ClpS [Dehalococcoidia bacterium]|nr:Clp protease ClpS [Dehalococcoidia bacterium]